MTCRRITKDYKGLQRITKDYKGLQIKMIITITIVSDQYRNIKDKNKK